MSTFLIVHNGDDEADDDATDRQRFADVGHAVAEFLKRVYEDEAEDVTLRYSA